MSTFRLSASLSLPLACACALALTPISTHLARSLAGSKDGSGKKGKKSKKDKREKRERERSGKSKASQRIKAALLADYEESDEHSYSAGGDGGTDPDAYDEEDVPYAHAGAGHAAHYAKRGPPITYVDPPPRAAEYAVEVADWGPARGAAKGKHNRSLNF